MRPPRACGVCALDRGVEDEVRGREVTVDGVVAIGEGSCRESSRTLGTCYRHPLDSTERTVVGSARTRTIDDPHVGALERAVSKYDKRFPCGRRRRRFLEENAMRKFLLTVSTAAFPLLLAIVALSPAAAASTPTSVSGAFLFTFTSETVTHLADGNTFIKFNFTEVTNGSVAGTRIGTGSLVIHPDGTLCARDSGVFNGSVGAASGTATISVSASGTLADFTANIVLTHGAGGLTGMHANVKAVGGATSATTLAGTYTGQAH